MKDLGVVYNATLYQACKTFVRAHVLVDGYFASDKQVYLLTRRLYRLLVKQFFIEGGIR